MYYKWWENYKTNTSARNHTQTTQEGDNKNIFKQTAKHIYVWKWAL